jgi:hypothetical protein
MSMLGVASAMGVTTFSLEKLLEGEATFGISSQLKISLSVLQDFINGKVNPIMAGQLGISASTLQELRDKIGKDGAIGLLIGLGVKNLSDKGSRSSSSI